MLAHACTHRPKFCTYKHCLEHAELFIYLSWNSLPVSPPFFFFICLLYYFCSSLSLSSPIPRSVRLLFTLEFPDMISMKTCSSGHALPVLPSTLIVLSCSHTGGHCQVSSELNGALSCVARHSGRENSFFTGGTTSISAAKRRLFH